ncbi:MAG TPA: aldehyde dehydrogenase, partial [Pseudomonadota bacterium]|nr:aldehyde dehydrogenase [Pseudomonadota bacterium]
GPYHGRIFLGSARLAGQSPGPGTVLPQLNHGGPGRAGDGHELGGVRGLEFYMQRCAVMGYKPTVEALLPRAASGPATPST